ncbi:AzlC family ABC transporter permease [Chromohalobacter sp. TMW 2.2308]|uniref:AzlC family ABC transporter permease n=1 Tax=Chromohalobacter TaxID=42054 RepID=UPI001FFC6AE6|nr:MULTISPECIES: AzlC family ABC transporter permease [Chromohalobacter]MCK2043042.1 AzlC family ABC transporter permease [Chromohalobacter moromii]MCT8515721.1 AzlC family ABC transporter permease [Chromohalobacter sp. TMW 2.2271]
MNRERAISSSWRSAGQGLRESLSLVVGYAPIAFSFGVIAVQSGLTLWQAVGISLLVFAGASQFVMVAMMAAGSGGLTVLSAVLMMNLRHVFYGPALATHLVALPRRLAPWLAFGLTDEVFATAMAKGASRPLEPAWCLGLAAGAYLAWVGGTALGASVGAGWANESGYVAQALDFVLPALFLALLAQAWRRARWPVVAVATSVTLLGMVWWPGHVAMLIGMLAGATVGSRRPRARCSQEAMT